MRVNESRKIGRKEVVLTTQEVGKETEWSFRVGGFLYRILRVWVVGCRFPKRRRRRCFFQITLYVNSLGNGGSGPCLVLGNAVA